MQLRLLSHAEQVASHLRQEILDGRWRGEMPGAAHLGDVLGVNHVTINQALRLLEGEGLLVAQGPKRARRIVVPRGGFRPKSSIRIAMLLYDDENRRSRHAVELIDLLHRAGVEASFSRKTLRDLGMDPGKVAKFVAKTDADAWIVVGGSHEVLAWFAGQKRPCLALFGRFTGLNIAAASPRAAPAVIKAVRRLTSLGHSRIVMLVREERRKPTPALVEQTFLDELEAQKVTTGRYNLPDWEDHPTGFTDCLDSLFRHTPPTALLFGEPRLFVAAQQHLARLGFFAPEHYSVVCADTHPTLGWCRPPIAHIRWDQGPVLRRVVRWAQNIRDGKTDVRQRLFNSEFAEGGTIGPVPGGK